MQVWGSVVCHRPSSLATWCGRCLGQATAKASSMSKRSAEHSERPMNAVSFTWIIEPRPDLTENSVQSSVCVQGRSLQTSCIRGFVKTEQDKTKRVQIAQFEEQLLDHVSDKIQLVTPLRRCGARWSPEVGRRTGQKES